MTRKQEKLTKYQTKMDFKIKVTKKDKKKEHYKMIKGSIQEVNITLINIYTPNKVAPYT